MGMLNLASRLVEIMTDKLCGDRSHSEVYFGAGGRVSPPVGSLVVSLALAGHMPALSSCPTIRRHL